MVELFKHDLILNFCKDKIVLHIGAADSPYHEERGRKGTLLHQKLQKICKQLVGIDIDKNAINYLKKFGINNIFYGDIVNEKYEINLKNYKWDYIIFGDVIEHLDNPGLALENLKKIMNKETKLIITTPNVFSFFNIKTFLTGKEYVHPDHTFWPSVKTMNKLLEIKNLKITFFAYCFYGEYKDVKTLKGKIFYKIIKNKFNYIAPCLFFIVMKK